MGLGLLTVFNHTWSAIAGDPAADSSRRERTQTLESLIEMRDELWREIGRLSFGHRSHLSDDPTYIDLLRDQGKVICRNGNGEGNPLIDDLVTQAQDLDERIRSLVAGSVMITSVH
mgnify:FL=1